MRATLQLLKRQRGTLDPKRVTNYNKSYGGGLQGTHTKHGGFRIDWDKVRTFVTPAEMDDFKLSPFVAKSKEKPKGTYIGEKGPMDPIQYYLRWRREGV